MACPYINGSVSDGSQDGDNNAKDGGITYGEYLKINELLACTAPLSGKPGVDMAHDEHLFIITHQTYELWFKQILFEIDSIRDFFRSSFQYLDERNTLVIIRRLYRVVVILKLLVDQFHIMETMTPLEFMDFRSYLSPASGFQSLQFRLLENKLGVEERLRVQYNKQHYQQVFRTKDSNCQIQESLHEPSLLQLVEKWLERTPGLDTKGFGFWKCYQQSAQNWLRNNWLIPAQEETDPERKEKTMEDYLNQKKTFDSIFDEDIHKSYIERGERRLSHKAFQGALMISLYRDEHRFQQPFQLLTHLMDIDSLLSKWRYNHMMMVQRMIGSKVGTGGSSGYMYLRSTCSDRYKVFVDLFNLSTFFLPRDQIPPLTAQMKHQLTYLGGLAETMFMNESNGVKDDTENCQDNMKNKGINNLMESGIKKVMKNCTENGTENKMKKVTENGMENCVENVTNNGLQNGIENNVENGEEKNKEVITESGMEKIIKNDKENRKGNDVKNGTENSIEKVTESVMENVTETCRENGTENSMSHDTDKSFGNTIENGMENRLEDTLESSMEDSIDSGMENSTEISMENSLENETESKYGKWQGAWYW